MNRGDRVFLVDNLGRHEGTVTALSHHKGEQLVMVKWDSGMTERVPREELTLVEENEVRPDGPETDKGGLIGQQPY